MAKNRKSRSKNRNKNLNVATHNGAKETERKVRIGNPRRVAKRSGFVASVTDRLKAGWTATSIDPDQLVRDNTKILRARSRDAYYNNAYVQRYVQIFTSNVIGKKGFNLQSKVTGFDNKPDTLARQAIEKAWHDYVDNKENIDYREMANLKGILDQAAYSLCIDGELFVRVRNGGDFGFSLEVVDTELIDSQYHGNVAGNENKIRSGIEYDNRNRAVAYHVSVPLHSSTSYFGAYTYGKRTFDRVPASEMFHVFPKDIVGLSRGLPPMAVILEDLLHMNKFQEANLVNARASAAKMGFFRDPDGTGNAYTGDDEDSNGSPIADVEAGSLEYIGNLEFQSFDPQFPADQYEKVMTQSLRTIASGLGIGYNDLANNLSDVNYSSIRHGAVESREFWFSRQRMMIDEFLSPLFKLWLTKQYESGSIGITPKGQKVAKALSRGIDWYTPHEFIGRAFDWIDPSKDIKAKKEEIDMNMTSLSEVIRSRGRDPDDVFAEIAEEKEKLEALGITTTEVLGNEQTASGNAEEEKPVNKSSDVQSSDD